MIILTSALTLQPVLVNPEHVRYGLIDGDGYTVLFFSVDVHMRVTETPETIWARTRGVRPGD